MVKPFIKKSEARVFRLVSKSLDEPPLDSEKKSNSNPYVLHEITRKETTKNSFTCSGLDDQQEDEREIELDYTEGNYDHIQGYTTTEMKQRREAGEAAKYGILLDDRDYDYTIHLKTIGEVPGGVFIDGKTGRKISNPNESSGFKSLKKIVAEDLNELAELNRLTYDPMLKSLETLDPDLKEVLEALDDETYQTVLEDNFISQIDAEEPEPDIDICTVDDYDYDNEDDISITDIQPTKREYSSTNEEYFDKFLNEEYSEEDYSNFGDVQTDSIKEEESLKENALIKLSLEDHYKKENRESELEELKDSIPLILQKYNSNFTNYQKETSLTEIDSKLPIRTHVNREKQPHPTVNVNWDIRVNPHEQRTTTALIKNINVIPILKPKRLLRKDPTIDTAVDKTSDEISTFNLSKSNNRNGHSTNQTRVKDESTDEKKVRKTLLKQEKRNRKEEKKQNKIKVKN